MRKSTKKLGLKKFQIVKLYQTHPIRGGRDNPTTGPKSKDMNDPTCIDTIGNTQGG